MHEVKSFKIITKNYLLYFYTLKTVFLPTKENSTIDK